jgi:chitodextrinase
MQKTLGRFLLAIGLLVVLSRSLLHVQREVLASTPGTVIAYAFDEGAGATTADLAGNNLTGTLVNGAGWTTGHSGTGLSVDGSTGYVTSGNVAALNGLTALTVSAWVQGAVGPASPDGIIVGKDQAFALVVGAGAPHKAQFGVKSGGTWYGFPSSASSVDDGAFHFLTGVYDGGAVQIYVDGLLEGSQPVGTLTLNAPATNIEIASCIGGPDCDPASGEMWRGVIDDVRVYSRALSAGEIVSDMNTPVVSPDKVGPSVPTNLSGAATSSTTISLSWTASTDSVGIAGYKVFRNAAQVATSSTATCSDNGLAPSTTYSYAVTAFDTAGNTSALSASVNVTTQGPGGPDTTPPTVSIVSPAQHGTVSGTVTVTASATDSVGVVGVQFMLDGANLGVELTAPPYAVSWNTAATSQIADGTHTLTATARDAAGNRATSAPIGVTVHDALVISPVYPVKPSWNNRYLVDRNNVPFLIIGDHVECASVNLSETDADAYFATRQSQGFNNVVIYLISDYTRADASTYDGILPFGYLPGSPQDVAHFDLSQPKETYFARADRMIQLAANHGLLVLLNPINTANFLEFAATLQNNGAAAARAYGQYLGSRYANVDNIIWYSGDDFQDWTNQSYDDLATAVALGIRDHDSRHMHTVELNFLSSGSLDDPNWAPIVSLNGTYTDYPAYVQTLSDYDRPNYVPDFLTETEFELGNYANNELATPLYLRRQEYWATLSGAAGVTYGNNFVWHFSSGWQGQLGSPGSIQLMYLKALLLSHNWFDLVPDQDHSVLVAGYGTFTTSGFVSDSDYAAAAVSPDRSLMIAYIPTSRAVTLDMTQFGSAMYAYWYDPTNGVYTPITGSPFPNAGTSNFVTPGANAAGDQDAVLVLEAGPRLMDTQAPSTPRGLSASPLSSTRIALSWTVASDNFGVAGYKIFRDGNQIGSSTIPGYSDGGVAPSTTYTYSVSAFDFSGNDSGLSQPMSVTTPNTPPPPPGAPIIAYAFDEASGSTTRDASGHGNIGVLVNGATWAPGHSGSAVSFDGTTGYVTGGNVTALSGLAAVTVSAWVKGAVGPTSPDAVIVGKDQAFVLAVVGGKALFSVKAAGTWYGFATSNSSVDDGAFHFLTSVYDGSNVQVYVDGVFEASQTIGALTLNAPPTNLEIASCIGGPDCDPASGEMWQGVIDDVRIYDRALAPSEIVNDMNTPVSGP